jgi:uncharacterized protein
MPSARLTGRIREQQALRRVVDSPEAELVAVYGRRRVGKTFLIREVLGPSICFELTGVYGASSATQLKNFADALARASGAAVPGPTLRDWQGAFGSLRALLERKLARGTAKQVLFIDELPWLASRRSGFLAAFEHFWNAWATRQPRLVVVVCGSASAWMVSKLIRSRGGLHNRVTRTLRLEPFTLSETESYLSSRHIDLGRYAILELYAALGGVPHYLKQVERGESPAQSIDRLCFAPGGPLRHEFRQLYASLFEHAERHERVVRTLAKRRQGMTRNAILADAGLTSGGRTSTLLDELEESGFVARIPQVGRATKDAHYRLVDEYSLFYIHWIERHRGRGDAVWGTRRGTPAWRSWSGYAFEAICLKHVPSLKRALGIEAVETVESAWHHRRPVDSKEGDTKEGDTKERDSSDSGAQIDLVIDRKDATINLCEMKFSEAPFVVDKRYGAELRHKRDTFRRVTGTRKALLTTMVTTFGLRDGAHAREVVDKTLEMGALFE